jgi:hypothetical protein
MTTSDDLAADLESLAARIERLSRERLLAVAADLRRRALTVRTTRSMGAIR